MKISFTTLFLFLALTRLSFANCSDYETSVMNDTACVSLQWIEGPYVNGPGERKFSNAQLSIRSLGDEIDLSEVYFYLWMKMPHNHQHGGAKIEVEALDETTFALTQILLRQMRGQWFVRVDFSGSTHSDPKVDFDFEIPLTDWN